MLHEAVMRFRPPKLIVYALDHDARAGVDARRRSDRKREREDVFVQGSVLTHMPGQDRRRFIAGARQEYRRARYPGDAGESKGDAAPPVWRYPVPRSARPAPRRSPQSGISRKRNRRSAAQPVVWVHDYHLMPLAKALRERGHKNRIGFFLHIPFPPPEILTALPHHERLIPSLSEYDLVGFQTGDDAFNFSRYLTRECGLHSHDFNFIVADRTVRVDVFPVGIETAAFAHLAQRSVRLPFVKRV